MAADHEQPDDGDEAQLAWLLTSAHDAPPMRGEFVRGAVAAAGRGICGGGRRFVQRNGQAAHAMNGGGSRSWKQWRKWRSLSRQARP